MVFACPQKLLATITACVILCCVGIPPQNEASRRNLLDCLNSRDNEKPFELSQHRECKDDKAKLSEYHEVVGTEKMLGLASDQITFIGCAAAPFRTRMVDLEPPFHFEILYTFNPSFTSQDYVAPTLHEIGHIYQLKKAGSTNKLLDSPIERLELGADFLAGLAAGRLGFKNPLLFERTLSLVGSYVAKSDSHSTPENRTKSFRYGFFYRSLDSTIDPIYADFQDNLFSQIKRDQE
jgi:hypothetical protein